MSKGDRNRAQSARQRIAAQQAAARKGERRRRVLLAGGSILLVILIVAGFFIARSLTSPGKHLGSGTLPSSVVSDITGVPGSTLTTVGTGALPAITSLPIKGISDKTLTTSGGKPEMLYIGAEFCPYCAAMRWSMAVALSRFGTFGPLTGIHSAPSPEIYPNTSTLTFYGQRYTSKYLTFTPVENETVTHTPLQQTTSQQQHIWAKYDSGPNGLGYPFLYFAGKVVITGPLYDPQVLHGLTWAQIASQLKSPSSAVAQNVNGAANYIIASICKATGNSPASVCSAAPIPAIEAKL